jgi:hypothetical protein
MKIIKLLSLLAFAFLLTFCKKNEESENVDQTALFEVVSVLDSAQSKFIEYANLTKGDFTQTMDLTEYWLMTQPNVQSTFSTGDGYIYINLKSGLKTTFYFNTVDDNGVSIYRGGKGGSTINAASEFINHANEVLTNNIIENKKVLLFETSRDLNLEPQIKIITDILNNSGLGLKVTVLKYEQCTVEAVETFKDYGLVIIDGHGDINTFQLGKNIDLTTKPKTKESVIHEIQTQLGSSDASKIGSGDIEIAASVKGNPQKSDWVKRIIKDGMYRTSISGKYIAALPPMTKTIIFGNMCYSGWILTSVSIPERKWLVDNKVYTIPATIKYFENPIGKAFIERNLISYYGFTRNEYKRDDIVLPIGSSRSVPDDFSKQVEKTFVQRLVTARDNTGIANLNTDNKTEYCDIDNSRGDLFFRHYGADNYSYDGDGGGGSAAPPH